MKLIDALEEDDDVQTVWGNYDVPDEELEKLALKILGLDPGARHDRLGPDRGRRQSPCAYRQRADQDRARRVAAAAAARNLADQLEALDRRSIGPDGAAVEEVFVNANPQSTLKLGQARGVVLMCAARAGIEVGEYAPTLVKKAVVGTGGAEKAQVHAMVSRLLPGAKIAGRTPPTRSPSRSPTRIIWRRSPRASLKPCGLNDRASLRNPRRNQRRQRGDRRRRRRLSGARSAHARSTRSGRSAARYLVLTELQVREDAWTLFGFGSAAERDTFRALTSRPGRRRPARARDPVGALARRTRARRQPGRQGDDRPRQRRRTQARRAHRQRAAGQARRRRRCWRGASSRAAGAAADALSALANLGFKPADASAAVNAAQDELGLEATLDSLVRLALRKAAK